MRFCLALTCAVFITLGSIPALCHPVYVHPRTKKAKKHKVPKHRSIQQ